MHGRSPMIDDRDYDTPYPTENDEDDVDRVPRIMENFRHLIRLCEILGDILRDLYMVKGRRQLSAMATPDSVISTLDKSLNAWMAKLQPSLRYRPPNTRIAEKAPAPALELCQVHMLFYTTLILLHRPFIPGPTQSTAPSVFPSASICTFAANKILDIAESLLVEGRLANVNNYSVYFMFTAGIIFIYNAASSDSMFAFEAKISITKIMRAMDEVEKTWITSARHCNILGELAGLREINLSGIDESYRRAKLPSPSVPPSIAVPNSPIMQQDSVEQQEPQPQQQMQEQQIPQQQSNLPRQPIDDESYATYYSIFNEKSPPSYTQMPHRSSSASVSSMSPGSQANEFNRASLSNVQPPPLLSNVAGEGRSGPPALGTEFWDMPVSFDFEEWNTYFVNQRPGASPAPPSNGDSMKPPLW